MHESAFQAGWLSAHMNYSIAISLSLLLCRVLFICLFVFPLPRLVLFLGGMCSWARSRPGGESSADYADGIGWGLLSLHLSASVFPFYFLNFENCFFIQGSDCWCKLEQGKGGDAMHLCKVSRRCAVAQPDIRHVGPTEPATSCQDFLRDSWLTAQ